MDSARRESDSSRRPLVRTPKFWIGLLVVVAITFFFVAKAMLGPSVSDSDQIVAALNASIEASKEGKAGGVLDQLSNAFQVNNQLVGGDQVAKMIQKLRPDITVADPKPLLDGNDATIISTVHAQVSFLGMHPSADLKDVVIKFHREVAHKWLIIPVSTWHMTSITLSPDSMDGVQSWASVLD